MRMNKLNILVLVFACMTGPALAQSITYPVTKKVDQTDDYFGTKVADPYRWLEDDRSAETALWVDMQNETTEKYLEQIPFRKKVKERLTRLYNYTRYTPPTRAGTNYFYSKNDGLQNQNVIYKTAAFQDSGSVFFDPNTLSAGGTTALALTRFSPDGKYMAYALAKAGSDWNEIHVRETATGRDLDDQVEWVKFSEIAWKGEGFYYSRYAANKDNPYNRKNEFHQVYYHRLGSPQSSDQLIYEDKNHPRRNFRATVTDGGRYLLISGSESTSGNNLMVKDLRNPKSVWLTLVEDFKHDFDVFGSIGDSLLVLTNLDAPRGRIVTTDLSKYVKGQWDELVPQQPEVMQSASQSMMRFAVQYMKDASNRMKVYFNNGTLLDEITFPVPVTIDAVSSDINDTLIFYSVSSFTFPSRVYRYQVLGRTSYKQFESNIDFYAGEFNTSIMVYKSKDGTEVPMFLVYKTGLDLNRDNPVLLFGYGGFNISKTPEFKPERLLFLESGGVFAMPNLRGGGEFGEEWHEAGTKLKKQNVFDDFIAAAEYLIENGFTNPGRIAISGRSNGGLLVGACMTQRPDLFRVALPAVGVMDMLRFQKFTIGWSWVADYGSSDNKEEFEALYKYSPLHRLQSGVNYPATLVTTGDHDDRVVPGHSLKFAATLQEKNTGEHPTLIRIDKDAGHGAGKPLSKLIDEQADVISFTLFNLGMSVK